jgi:hypothetical protein
MHLCYTWVMLRVITWCAKCLFLYFLVVIAAVRYSWVFTVPVWQVALKMHWTQLNRTNYVLSYFLPIFAITGLLIGLIPFGRLGKAIGELFASFFPSASSKLAPEPDPIAPVLCAWIPVTLAFLVRFATWQSRNSSVLDPHLSAGRVERFFGPLRSQTPGLIDNRWISDRFIFTGPMLFLMACAIAVLLRHRLTGSGQTAVDSTES